MCVCVCVCVCNTASTRMKLSQDGHCHISPSMCGASLSTFRNVPSGNISALVAAIYEVGPISVAIDASHKSFSFYADGVYYEPACGKCVGCLHLVVWFSGMSKRLV